MHNPCTLLIGTITLDVVFRLMAAGMGVGIIGVAVFAKGEFRWGRSGQGGRAEPQWVGRAFFILIGSLMLYVAATGFR
jgi:hypothetical protein